MRKKKLPTRVPCLFIVFFSLALQCPVKYYFSKINYIDTFSPQPFYYTLIIKLGTIFIPSQDLQHFDSFYFNLLFVTYSSVGFNKLIRLTYPPTQYKRLNKSSITLIFPCVAALYIISLLPLFSNNQPLICSHPYDFPFSIMS